MTIPLPNIANTFRCAMSWSGVASPGSAVNVIHIRALSPPATPADVYATLNASVTQAMWGQTLTTVAVDSVKITPLDLVSASVIFNTGRPVKWTGAFGSGEIEPAVSALVSLYTVQRGRKHRGRIFLPFVAEGVSAQGQVSPGVLTSMQTAWTAFQTAMGSAAKPMELVVASYDRHGSPPNPLALTASTITVQTFLATQRRRQTRLRFP